MLDSPTKKDAAIACQLEPNTVYKWNGVVDDVVEILLDRAADSAFDILEGQVVRAAMVKVSGLDSDDEKVRQAEATEVLDRVLGKATQKTEVSSPDGLRFVVEYVNDWRTEQKMSTASGPDSDS